MLEKAVEYLIQNPEEKEKFIEGQIDLIGISNLEKKAVLDVIQSPDVISPLVYW